MISKITNVPSLLQRDVKAGAGVERIPQNIILDDDKDIPRDDQEGNDRVQSQGVLDEDEILSEEEKGDDL